MDGELDGLNGQGCRAALNQYVARQQELQRGFSAIGCEHLLDIGVGFFPTSSTLVWCVRTKWNGTPERTSGKSDVREKGT